MDRVTLRDLLHDRFHMSDDFFMDRGKLAKGEGRGCWVQGKLAVGEGRGYWVQW